MPTRGLSLVGFLDQDPALEHLRNVCVPADPSDAALIATWRAAQAQLGATIANAGNPNIRDIPTTEQHHIDQLVQQAWVVASMQGPLQGSIFRLVEIDPLLAFQYTVDIDRSDHHCGQIGQPPSLSELLHVCLPITPPPEHFMVSHHDKFAHIQSAIIKSRSLNIRVTAQGVFKDPNGVPVAAGFQFGPALPLVQVVRFGGQCFLHNGFHRAVGARQRGATHIPCLLRDVGSYAEVGLRPEGTFQPQHFALPSPPAVGHFTQGRAQAVLLRAMTQIMHITWATHVVPDE